MKKIFALAAAAALSAGALFAAPKAEWIPADSVLTAAVLRAPDKQAERTEAVWKAEAKKAALDLGSNEAELKLEALPPESHPLLKALGYKTGFDDIRLRSLAFGFIADFNPGAGKTSAPLVVLTGEIDTINFIALDQALYDLLRKDKEASLSHRDEWRIVRDKTSMDPEAPCFGYRPVRGGVQLASTLSFDVLEAFMAGKVPMKKAGDPAIGKLFAMPKGAAASGCAMLSDLAALLTESLGKEKGADTVRQAQAMFPWAFATHALALKTYFTEKKFSFTLAAQTKDAATAAAVRDQLIMLKGLFQMGLAQQAAAGNCTALPAAVAAITCEAKEDVAQLQLTLTPAQAVAALNDLNTLSNASRKASQPQVNAPALPNPSAGTTSEKMSDEEMMQILNEK